MSKQEARDMTMLRRVPLTIDDRINAYLATVEPIEHSELHKLRVATSALPNAFMQIAPEQGHFLALLTRLIGARRTLEVGTFTGYSTLALALALSQKGHLVTCDICQEWPDIGRPHWRNAGVAEKIELRIGPALDTLHQLEREGAGGSFDLAFIDADKESYDSYYEVALRLVRIGGLIVLDNMLRLGRVADPADTDPSIVASRNLNAKIATDERVDRVVLPIGDGMTLARRRE